MEFRLELGLDPEGKGGRVSLSFRSGARPSAATASAAMVRAAHLEPEYSTNLSTTLLSLRWEGVHDTRRQDDSFENVWVCRPGANLRHRPPSLLD